MIDIYKYENELYEKGYKLIAGCDEAGRGPMAGPLVASSVILPVGYKLEGLNDSKKLTAKKRDQLFDIIMRDAVEVAVTVVSVEDVDKLNVYSASKYAMTECVKKFKNKPDYVLTDCMPLEEIEKSGLEVLDIIKGDAKSASIAASSIIAKVTRDRIMDKLDEEFPQYGFKKHKGYVTKLHREMIAKYGVTVHHRKTFAPVKEIIEKNNGELWKQEELKLF